MAGHHFPSASSLTGCLRQAWLKQTMDYYEYPTSRISLLVGTAFHAILEDTAEAEAMAEIKVQWTTPEGVAVKGIVDYWHPDQGVIRDWKSAKKIIVARLPYGNHETQTNIYRWLLMHNEVGPQGEATRLEVVYFDKSGPDKNGSHPGIVVAPIPVWSDEKIERFIRKRAAILQGAMDNGTIPPMVRKQDRWMCRYCPVNIRERCEALGS